MGELRELIRTMSVPMHNSCNSNKFVQLVLNNSIRVIRINSCN